MLERNPILKLFDVTQWQGNGNVDVEYGRWLGCVGSGRDGEMDATHHHRRVSERGRGDQTTTSNSIIKDWIRNFCYGNEGVCSKCSHCPRPIFSPTERPIPSPRRRFNWKNIKRRAWVSADSPASFPNNEAGEYWDYFIHKNVRSVPGILRQLDVTGRQLRWSGYARVSKKRHSIIKPFDYG